MCPLPPALVPELAGGAAAELDPLRQACDEAVAALVRQAPDRIVVLTSGTRERTWPIDAVPDLAPYGLGRGGEPDSTGTVRAGGPPAPLGLSIGAWLLDRNAVQQPRTYLETDGGAVAQLSSRTALLVMADGSAKRGPNAPGAYDARAGPFDAQVAAALAAADGETLRALDHERATELMVDGVAALHALGEALGAHGPRAQVRLVYDAAPYGVGYFVAVADVLPGY